MTPEAVIVVVGVRPEVGREQQLERGGELEGAFVKAARGSRVAASQELHEPLGEALPVTSLDGGHQAGAREARDVLTGTAPLALQRFC